MRSRHFVQAICVLAAVSAAAAEARLVSERTEGMRRYCIYEVAPGTPRVAPAAPNERTGTNLRQILVGLGETCPGQYPREERQRPAAIPSLAVLKGESRDGSTRVCVYALGAREYRRRVATGRSCPLTPHF